MNPYAPSWIPYSKHKPSSINNKLMVLISLPLPSLPTSFQSYVGHCLHRMFTHPLMRYLKSLCNVYPIIGMERERELMAGPDCSELWWQLHPPTYQVLRPLEGRSRGCSTPMCYPLGLHCLCQSGNEAPTSSRTTASILKCSRNLIPSCVLFLLHTKCSNTAVFLHHYVSTPLMFCPNPCPDPKPSPSVQITMGAFV